MITISDEELAAIVADVKRELDKGAEAAIAQLHKSDDDDTVGQEDSPADAPPESPVDASASPAPASPDASASPAPDASAPVSADPAAQSADTAETLAADYGTLSPEDFQMHLQAMKMAAAQKGMDLAAMLAPAPAAPAADPLAAAAASASPAASPAPMAAPAADPMASASPAPAASASPVASPAPASPDPLAALKSEKENEELAELRKNQAALETQMEQMANAMKKYFNQPLSKAVTRASDVEFVAKPGTAPEAKVEKTFTPVEVLAGLRKAARNPELKKSDRDLIDSYVEKKATYEQIKHLLG